MAERAAVDMWVVQCARCRVKIGATNGNEGLPAIYCVTCEPILIKETDELMRRLAEYTVGARLR